jgi:phosphopantetheinyl transferase (holo-ACP synthase)
LYESLSLSGKKLFVLTNKKYDFIVSVSHEKEFAVGIVIAFRK